MNTTAGPNCYHCQGFYVTHQPARPYGCRIMGFISSTFPATEVRLASGQPCRAWQPKATQKPGGKKPA